MVQLSYEFDRQVDVMDLPRSLIMKMGVLMEIRAVASGGPLEVDLTDQLALHQGLETVIDRRERDASGYYKKLYSKMDLLKIDRKFTSRAVNDGFSGGEKKRCEILQMAMLEPHFALMDETDSGLDIDALRIVADGVNTLRSGPLGILLITHYQRLLDYIVPDFVHVMYDGRIVKSGNKSLALELEAKGYDWVKQEFAAANA